MLLKMVGLDPNDIRKRNNGLDSALENIEQSQKYESVVFRNGRIDFAV